VQINGQQSYTLQGAGSTYHSYSLVYDPFEQNADLFIDGIERISNVTGEAQPLATPFIFWGSGDSISTGNANYATVEFVSSILTITDQPHSQVGYWGKSATFSVGISGVAPLSYQWFKGSLPIEGATGSLLVLSNLQDSTAGDYKVVVTDTLGFTVTSQLATLTVKTAEVSIAIYPGVKIDGVVGQTYGIQATVNLAEPSGWVGVTNLTLTEATQIWYDSKSTSEQPKHFYRVVAGPVSIP